MEKDTKRINLVASDGDAVAYQDKETVEQHLKKAKKYCAFWQRLRMRTLP